MEEEKGEQSGNVGSSSMSTSTRDMLLAPFSAPTRPKPPPENFTHREKINYRTSNPFTDHDNRNHFQVCGEYFGDGKDTRLLGRRLYSFGHKLHTAKPDLLSEPKSCHWKSVTASSFKPFDGVYKLPRRFPKVYKPPDQEYDLSTKTTNWHSTNPRTALSVLSATQEPFLPHNSWRYSYHGSHKVYPPYNLKQAKGISNIFNRYGAAFVDTQPPLNRKLS